MKEIVDRFSGRHSTAVSGAVAAFEDAVLAIALHRPIADPLSRALRHDPGMPAALALSGIAAATMGREVGFAQARALLPKAEAALHAARGGTGSERVLVEAHAFAAAGSLRRAAACLEHHVSRHANDFLALKLAHALRFMTGEADRMLATLDAALASWSPRDAGFGFLQGCRAFALEETGQLEQAEVAGRRAVASEPGDVWALHAVAHVMEMSGRTAEGKAWLQSNRAGWKPCAAFGQHLAWHLALLHVAEGEHAAALDLFDGELEPARDGDFRDVANAVALLWRLEQHGVDVGSRWEQVREIADRRRRDCAYVFASLHYLLALIAARAIDEAEDVASQLSQAAARASSEQEVVAARIGTPLAEALIAFAKGHTYPCDLALLAGRLKQLGGSNAQRDLFLRTLMVIAVDKGDIHAWQAISDIRLQQRRADRFHAALERKAVQSRVSRMAAVSASRQQAAAWR